MISAKITFWGVRGSMATPGRKTAGVGGNTSCVKIEYGQTLIICDAGTGIRPLGIDLKKRFGRKPISAHILLSHLHWDHYIGLPFFKPLYEKKNYFVIGGPAGDGAEFGKSLAGTMQKPYFPIELKDVSAKISLETIRNKEFKVGQVKIVPFRVNHPDGAVGWRFYFPNGKSLVHITDNEPDTERGVGRLVEWMKGADVLIHDAQYSSKNYRRHKGWGHSPVSYPVELAAKAKISRLYLFHFDPEADDRHVKASLAYARKFALARHLKVHCAIAREGLSFRI